MKLFRSKKKETQAEEIDLENLPRHVAIIMDGNGRWATRRGLPRTAGHAAGAEAFRNIATSCKNLGLDYLTVYAFSTENWKRPKNEVDTIMGLLEKYLLEAISTMEKEQIRMKILGDIAPLSPKLQQLIARTEEISSKLEDSSFQVNICLNYGGRDEIVKAAKRYAEAVVSGKADPEALTEAEFAAYLYTDEIPDPELIIRPSGEQRLSNFLLWQAAYSEFYFCDVLWPDFDEETLKTAIAAFQKRKRRFGDVR